MAKKSFKNNPALQFITVQEEPEEKAAPVVEATAPAPKPAQAKKPAAPAAQRQSAGRAKAGPKPQAKPAAETTNAPEPAKIAPKSILEATGENPRAPQESPPEAKKGQPVPMKLNPMYIETRSKRVQLLMQPSLHDRLRQLAGSRGQSLNDLVHEALEQFAERGE